MAKLLRLPKCFLQNIEEKGRREIDLNIHKLVKI